MSKKSPSQLSSRKEFFGSVAKLPSSNALSPSEGPSDSQDLLRRSGRNQNQTPTAATAPAHSRMPVRNVSEPSRQERSRSASRVRAPAVLSSDGQLQAARISAPAQVVECESRNLAPPPQPQQGREGNRKRALNHDAPAFIPASAAHQPDSRAPGFHIPVHLSPDCEWDDDQVLAADDLRRAASNPAEFFSTGSAGTQGPAEVVHESAEAPASNQDLHPPGSAANPITPGEPAEPAAKKQKKTRKVAPPPSVIDPTPLVAPVSAPVVEQETSRRPKNAKTSSRFPQTLLDRSQEKAVEASKWKLVTKAIGKPRPVFEPIKVRQSTFDALHPKDRPLFEVVYPSDPSSSSSSSSSSGDESMNDRLEEAPASGSSSGRKRGLAVSGWPRGYAYPQETAKSHAPNVEVAPEFVQRVLLLVRPLPPSSVNGSCLFDSISYGLSHILKHDISAFGACSSRSASEGIQALTDPAILRSLICDHLEGPFADMPLECLHGQSPRRAVLEDYVAHGYPLVDAEWTPPATDPKQPYQTVRNYKEYIAAMRKRSASGDEICLAASADLLGLRHIVFDTRTQTTLGATDERAVDLSLDLIPENLLFELRANRAERRLSSRMPLFLLRTDAHFA